MPTTEGYNGAFTGAQIDEAIGQVRGKNLPADGVKFPDGETFQEKYDSGELTGPQGPAGADGEPGATGPTGADGEDGGYYKPAVDASGNLTWTASKSGMPAVSGRNIRGPQGEQGPQGPAGANGKSAYQYAVDAGYTGTETDLSAALASLGDLNSILDTINGEAV